MGAGYSFGAPGVHCAPIHARDTIAGLLVPVPGSPARWRGPKTRFLRRLIALPPPPNAPRLHDVSLDDKYALDKGRVFLTGTQALSAC